MGESAAVGWFQSIIFHTLGRVCLVLPLTECHQSFDTLRMTRREGWFGEGKSILKRRIFKRK